MHITKDQLKQTFLEVIKINSFYPNDLAMRDYVVAWCAEYDIDCELDDFGNVIASLPGREGAAAIMLNTHLDIPENTPWPHYRETPGSIKGTGQTILGADPKTGLAVLLELMRVMTKEDPEQRAPVDFVFTRGEEQGLLGASGLDITKVRARVGLVVDQDGPATEVVTKAPGKVKFQGSFIGKTVHTREPELGVNALQILTDAIAKVPLGHTDVSKRVTWNIGTVNAGAAVNSVPGRAEFAAEMRSFDGKLLQSEAKRIYNIFEKTASLAGGKMEAMQQTMYLPYTLSAEDELLARMNESYRHLSLEPSYLETFGASDANIFNARGIHSVPVGSGYYHAHQYTERADLKDMRQLAVFLDGFVRASADIAQPATGKRSPLERYRIFAKKITRALKLPPLHLKR